MLKTSSRHVLKTSSGRLEEQQMFAGLFLFVIETKLANFASYNTIYVKHEDISKLTEKTKFERRKKIIRISY